MRTFLAVGLLMTAAGARAVSPEEKGLERAARLALGCLHKQYPNKLTHIMESNRDARTPRALHPAFYGCFDWHSSVHGHWMLARLARLYPKKPFARKARAAIKRSLTREKILKEVEYFVPKERASFERPYGLAWLLTLALELREWKHPEAREWVRNLKPLEEAAAAAFQGWIPLLTRPIRTGEHSQTAFAFGLVLDWARGAGNKKLEREVGLRVAEFYGMDRECPMAYEPSGQDFLSPCLAEADLMRRVLPPADFSKWLADFLPDLPRDGSAGWLPVGIVIDPTDGKLAHLDGLNLSRAWMLEGIAAGLPDGDSRIPALMAAALAHRNSGIKALAAEHYAGGHWLGSFAVYLITGRGLPGQ